MKETMSSLFDGRCRCVKDRDGNITYLCDMDRKGGGKAYLFDKKKGD